MRFGILGPVTVATDDGRGIAVRGAKPRAILAALLLFRDQALSGERLAVALWGEDVSPTTAGTVRVHVSRLRAALGDPQLLTTTAAGYRVLVQPGEVDAERFEDQLFAGRRELAAGRAEAAAVLLREALALWRGAPLADVELQSFARAEIARFEELRLTALELRIEADLAAGRHDELVGELQPLTAQHPWRERFHAHLMLALYRTGRQADALAVYRAARDHLVDGLGVEPGPDLRELHRAILDHDADLRLTAPPEPSHAAGAPGGDGILVALDGPSDTGPLLSLAARLAASGRSELTLTRIVPDASALDAAVRELEADRRLFANGSLAVRAAAFTSPSLGDDLVLLAREQRVQLLLMRAPDALLETGRPDGDLAHVLDEMPCHSLLLAARGAAVEVSTDRPVVVPFGGAEHEWAAVELGAKIARAYGGRLVLAGARADPDRGRRDASRLLARAALMVQRAVAVPTDSRLIESGSEGVLTAATGAGLVVFGFSSRWRQDGLGTTRQTILRDAPAPCAVVGRSTQPGGLTPRRTLTRFTWTRGAPD
jgi:DNA-binding SARP family transcriptional activator